MPDPELLQRFFCDASDLVVVLEPSRRVLMVNPPSSGSSRVVRRAWTSSNS